MKDWTTPTGPGDGDGDQGSDRPGSGRVVPFARDWTTDITGDGRGGSGEDCEVSGPAGPKADRTTGQSEGISSAAATDWTTSAASTAPKSSSPVTCQSGDAAGTDGRPQQANMPGAASPVKVTWDDDGPGGGGRWGRVVIGVIAGLGVVAAVVAGVYASGLMRDVEPVAVSPGAQTSVEVTPTAPATTTRPRPAVDPDNAKVAVAGGCHLGDGQVVQEATQRSLRGAVVAFESEYFAHNPEGIPGLLHSSSSMLLPKDKREALGDKARDPQVIRDAAVEYWRGVLDGIAPGSTWCLVMQPQSMNRVSASLEVTGAGQTVTYHQVIDGVRGGDGKWQIKEIVAVDK
ncbi:hypothetical protein [Corynebacterium bovis]|uniref:hypothetical protein n=1 Tax=Corynebacterium bovis TaxID=36808 RepID=UPI000F64E7D8|nr:hypothetical protein [Corynebacterium bovis]